MASEIPHTSEPVVPDKFARPTGSTALAMEVNALTTRLAALEAALKAALAECNEWHMVFDGRPYDDEVHDPECSIGKARAETDRLRKECGL